MELKCILCDSDNWEEGDSKIDCEEGTFILEGCCNDCQSVFKMRFKCIHTFLKKQGKKK